MYLFPLLSLGVLWSSKVPAFLPQFPSPAYQLPKFTGNQGRLHVLHLIPLLFGPASQGGLWTLRKQGAGNPSVRSVTSPLESCWWWMKLFLVQFCEGFICIEWGDFSLWTSGWDGQSISPCCTKGWSGLDLTLEVCDQREQVTKCAHSGICWWMWNN